MDMSLRYDGYVQIRPNFYDLGYHAFVGRITYRCWDHAEGEYVDTRYWTAYGQSQYDGHIYSKSAVAYDSIYGDPETRFFLYFGWIIHDGPWPLGGEGEETI